eukprot:5302201-Pyramimonas_sp.AAC.1
MLRQAASESTRIVVHGMLCFVGLLGIVVRRGVVAPATREICAVSDRLRILVLRLVLGAELGGRLGPRPIAVLGDCPGLGLVEEGA